MNNLRKADAEAQKGKVCTRAMRRHNAHAEENLQRLRDMILSLSFPPVKYTYMTVTNEEKERSIAKKSFYPWRILDHAIMLVIGDTIHKALIHDSFACVKGKGLHFGVQRMKMMLRRYPDLVWFGKSDLKKFYESIPHELIESALRRKFKDERFIQLVRISLFSYESDVETLIDEEIRKKRGCNWSVHKSTARQLCPVRDRSLHKRKTSGEVLSPVLRRCGMAGEDKGRSNPNSSRIRQTRESHGINSKT